MPEDRYSTDFSKDESFEKDIKDFRDSAQSFMNSMVQLNKSQKDQIEYLKRQLKDSQEELIDYKRELNILKNQPNSFEIMRTVLPILSDIVEETLLICEGDKDTDAQKLEDIKATVFSSCSRMVRSLDKKGINVKMHRPGDDYDRIALRESFTKSTSNKELDGKIAISRFGFVIPSIERSMDETVILYKYEGKDSENKIDVPEEACVTDAETKTTPIENATDSATEEALDMAPINDEPKEESIEILTYEEIGFGACSEKCNGNDLTVPIGKCGDQIYNLRFSCVADNQGYIVLGRTRSGKTSMLEAAIMNGSMKYSHKDLKFWLADFKNNEIFCKYVNSGIPHIRGIYGEINGLTAALNELKREISRRYELFSSEGQRAKGRDFINIAEYNEYLDKNSKAHERLNRIVFLMDEAQGMFKDCDGSVNKEEIANLISSLSRIGASVGVYFLILTQDFSESDTCILRDELVSKMDGKITFGLSRGALNVSGFGSNFTNIYQNIDSLKRGEAYAVNSKAEAPKKIKTAFCPQEKFDGYCKMILEKSAHPSNLEEASAEEKSVKKDRYVVFNTDVTVKQRGFTPSYTTLIKRGVEYPISENPNALRLPKNNAFSLEGAVNSSSIDIRDNELLWCITDRGQHNSDELYLEMASQLEDGYLVNQKIDKSFIRIITKEK